MNVPWCVYLCVVLLLESYNVNAARGRGSHSYPKSGGLSGHGGSHSYPPSRGGLSGNNHGYPASSGVSGNSHGYPSSGGNHGYPSSGGNHGYPSSGGLSGNSASKPNTGGTYNSHTTNIHNNYHYTPPQQIRYTPMNGAPMNYPVYHGSPPNYVYQYKNSGSKYGTLLAGLALLNLGTLAGTAYAIHKTNSNSKYKPQPGEVCKFGVKKENGDYEETRIDCQLITSFILQDQEKSQNGGTNITTVTTTVTNVTMVNSTNGEAPVPRATEPPAPGNVIYTMLPNGTLVPVNGTYLVNGTLVNANATSPDGTPAPSSDAAQSSVIITTTNTTTTSTNALDVKGKPVDVTPGMVCYVIRNSPVSNMKKSVPCGLLQTYAEKSLKKNSATRNIPLFTTVAVVAAMVLAY